MIYFFIEVLMKMDSWENHIPRSQALARYYYDGDDPSEIPGPSEVRKK